MKNSVFDYVIRVCKAPSDVAASDWNALLDLQANPTPFMRHAYLDALHESKSAVTRTGWTAAFITLWLTVDGKEQLHAACALYVKAHSYGEYVFDWAWANAYEQHGLEYYPKAVVAVPFTPVPGTRLMARDAAARAALVHAMVAWSAENKLSSLHLLFGDDDDTAACEQAGLMLRHTVQFHWHNQHPLQARPFGSFEDFLASLNQEKRKKIRQERRKVHDAGVEFRWARGADITPQDWDFFYSCYERTYLEHGNAPYLKRDFFRRMEGNPDWLMFIASVDGRQIASSLVAVAQDAHGQLICWGRYWGALARVDCLHFEACYYQPLAWCIDHGVARFEGGAQGEHKMARALMPVKTSSAHWLAHPSFADAVERFLEREGEGIDNYMQSLDSRSPFRHET